jgi:CRISPR system Cascade subunit CasA
MHDLLRDSLIGVRTTRGDLKLSLPGVFARLLSDEIEDFTGLRAHQSDPWHVLLVQLAASVMARHPNDRTPPPDEHFWREGLLDLADGCTTAWQLVVDDVTKPAFMQHPLRDAAELKAFKPTQPAARYPDELDVLVTAKDHDVKLARMQSADGAAWLFALVTCQTTSGFLGAGNYGSVRMNGGFGSRSIVSMVSSIAVWSRFVEELAVVRTLRGRALAAGLSQDRGIVLTWLRPWDRADAQEALFNLEPWFIEAVRPVRLRQYAEGVVALTSTSAARQIGPASVSNGDVGDPWLPINVSDPKKGRSALTVSASGWTPERLSQLLLQQGFELTPLQLPRGDMGGGAWLVASVLARGQGRTEGFHRIALPIPAKVLPTLGKPGERERLAKAAAVLRNDAADVQSTLKVVLMTLALGGPDQVNLQNETAARWVAACIESFTRRWSEPYFDALWRLAEEPADIVRRGWRTQLVAQAQAILLEAESRMPGSAGRRWRARVRAHSLLNGSLRKKGLIDTAPESSLDPPLIQEVP